MVKDSGGRMEPRQGDQYIRETYGFAPVGELGPARILDNRKLIDPDATRQTLRVRIVVASIET